MAELPLAALDRIIRKSSGLRVSETAAKELGLFLELEGEKISRQAGEYAKHANRKTIIDSDIRLATKK
ncbi:MAG: histone [archaeon]